jgi:ubiquitin-protein ligase
MNSNLSLIENDSLRNKITECDLINDIIKFHNLKNDIVSFKTQYQYFPNCKIYVHLPTKTTGVFVTTKINYFSNNIETINTYIQAKKPTLRRLSVFINKEFAKFNFTDMNIVSPILLKYFQGNSLTSSLIESKLNTLLTKVDSSGSTENLINDFVRIRSLNKNVVLSAKNNIREWNINFNNFTKDDLVAKEIKVKLLFSNIYPFYPPEIKVIKPYLKNNLAKKIADLKLVNFNYWSASVDTNHIINKLHEILNTMAVIDETVSKYTKLEQLIIRLETLLGLEEEIQVDGLIRFNDNDVNDSKTKYVPQKSKMNGIGYSDEGGSHWNPEEAILIQNKRDNEINQKLVEISNEILIEPNINIELVKKSLITYIKNMLNTTLFDIEKRFDVYKNIFTVLINLAGVCGNAVFDNDIVKIIKSLHDDNLEIRRLSGLSSSTASSSVATGPITPQEEIYNFIASLASMMSYEDEVSPVNENIVVSNISNYVTEMDKIKFQVCPLPNVTKFKVLNSKKAISENNFTSTLTTKRVARELSALKKTLPISYESSIIIRVHEKNTRFIRVMITGPADTPYDSGVFIFDLYITDDFPNVPPSLIIVNGGGRRLNPNLYECGKVCLSLLGTWDGEKWNPKTSTLIQLLISVQAQILCSNPFFNEPGYQNIFGTPEGDKKSKAYDDNIMYYVMTNNIYGALANADAYPEFKDAILLHFKNKKDYILTVIDSWLNKTKEINKGTYLSIINNIKNLFNTLN